ncbi:MAG TPA: PAS domain S-box protein [Archangium sp.]|jgi:PAS domain S-box-containing protein|uniref:PAS domain S-box protein n=1 Tax=Archangium sp. TaxID=1872627 RepID=UPI002ED800FF
MKLFLVGPPAEGFLLPLLSQWGHEVHLAPVAEQLESWPLGVDGVLVSGPGREILEHLTRLRLPDTGARPFLVALLPASNEPVPLEALLAAAVDDFLVVPFEPAQLQNRLEWLRLRRATGRTQSPARDAPTRGVQERLTAIIQTQNDVALAGLELEKVMALIAERAQQLCGADGASVALTEGDELVYHVTLGSQAAHPGFRLKLGESLTGQSVLRGEMLHTRDTENDPRVNVAATRRTGIRSMIVVPLQRDGRTVGALNVVYSQPHAYDDLDVRTLELMGQLLGVAMSNAAEFEARHLVLTEFADTLGALQQSQELFHSFMNHSPLLAFMKDTMGRRTWVNDSYARFFQLDTHTLLKLRDDELLPPEVAERMRLEERLVLSTGQTHCAEQPIPAPDGTEHHWLIHRFALRDALGQQLLGGVGVDITALKNAEQALRRSEENSRALIEGLPEAIFVHREGSLLYVNPAGLTFLGHGSAQELVGKSLLELIHPEDRDAAAARVLESDYGPMREVRFLRAGGQVVTAELSAMRLLFGGEPATVVSARNITERKQMQASLLLADRLASVGTLAAGIAHEVNNPLAFVLANLGFLDDECQRLIREQPGERIREMHEVLHETLQGAERIRHIVRDLQTLSRHDGEQRTLVDVCEVLESSLRLMRTELRHRARVVKDFEPVSTVWGSEVRLGQVFLNLLINAGHALPPGLPDRNEVRVRVRGLNAQVIIEVTDTGTGIDPAVRDRIFDPFFTTKPVGKGTGLGLSICHGIVTSLGGELSVESELGKGSTFRIILPAAEGQVKKVAS